MITTQLQFLSALMRLVAVYFGLKCLDSVSGAIMAHSFQVSISRDVAERLPNIWTMFIPSMAIYLILVGITWLAAPYVCKLALKSSGPPQSTTDVVAVGNLSLAETMIFLTGILMIGMGVDRVANCLVSMFKASSRTTLYDMPLYVKVPLFVGFGLAGFGAILAIRFSSVYGWCQKRKRGTTQPELS